MAVNKVEYFGKILLDLTEDTVTPDTLAEGVTAHGANGEAIVGTMKSGEDLEAVLNEQETLIATLQETLNGKASGGGTAEVWSGVIESVSNGLLGHHFDLLYIDENGVANELPINLRTVTEITLQASAGVMVILSNCNRGWGGGISTQSAVDCTTAYSESKPFRAIQITGNNFYIGVNA